MNGRTPLSVWNTAERLRRAGDDELTFLMQAKGVYKVGPNGVAFKVGGATVKYGGSDPKLYPFIGRDVFITVDPSAISHCCAFTEDRKRFIGRLESNERISPLAHADELREANASVKRKRKPMRRAQRQSPERTRDAVAELAAKRRERVAQLRTGTDDLVCEATIEPVATGFESSAGRAIASKRETRPRRSSAIDRSIIDAAFAPPPPQEDAEPQESECTLAMLAGGWPNTGDPSQDADGDQDHGTDADSSTDVLSLIAGNRHDGHDG